jgi:hypothetical protein
LLEWRERTEAHLTGPNLMREKRWTQLYVEGATPEAAAHETNMLYGNSQARPKGRH